ncbi:MAG: DNA polymerase I [Candidatus Saccharibacteria bacterium]|nr:DNA polymerase I [Candidatus Saccharibacteria bacterium]
MKRLVVIDGKSVFYRGYYAMPNLSMRDGTPTGGVYGFAALSLEVIKTLKPDYVAVAWDKPKTNIRRRKEIYPDYKAGRKPAPPDFYAQVPILHELLEAFGWPLYEFDDYEADDIMGALSEDANKKGVETVLITSDLDMLQLIDKDTHVYALKKGFSQIEQFNLKSFEEKYGLKQSQFLDLKSLQGDSSDNIPGVPGVGAKTATTLLQKYETLDGIYEHIDEITGGVHDKLVAGKDSAYMSKEIARIWTDAPIKFNPSTTDIDKLDREKLREMLEKLEFRSLLKSLPEGMQGEQRENTSLKPATIAPMDDSGRTSIIMAENVVITPIEDKLILSPNADTGYIVCIDEAPSLLKKSKITAYDSKSILKSLLDIGNELPTVHHDIRQASFLLDASRAVLSLEDLAMVDLAEDDGSKTLAALWSIYEQQTEAFKELPGVEKVAHEIDFPLVNVLARMEHKGIKIDPKFFDVMSKDLAKQLAEIEKQAYESVGSEFNMASPSQLAEVLYDKLQLPTTNVKKGKTGYSTGAKELEKLHGQHPIIELIEKHRELSKLKNTYVDALPKLADENNRLHTNFRQDVAATGRLSSIDPNLQNIPVRTELGRKIRQGFITDKGYVFVSADYSQFELRLAAVLSGDKAMIDAFNNDDDIHVLTAASIAGVEPREVTKEMRYRAKAVNFGILYGQGSHGLAVGTGMTFGEAKDFIEKYFELRPKLKGYMDSLRDKAHNDGFVETLLGRRRPTPDVKSSNFIVRQAAERAATNMPIQGTAADLTKMAMLQVEEKLEGGLGFQLLQIHDSILVVTLEKDAEKVGNILKETMENVYPNLGVKLKVDVSIGSDWGKV